MKLISMILLFAFAGFARAQTITYGDLMVEDQSKKDWKQFSIGTVGGYDVTNPYLNTYSYGYRLGRELNRHFQYGTEGLFYSVSDSRYNSNLEKDLHTFGVEAAHDRPVFQVSVKVAAHVLQGRVNLFSRKALPFRFDLRGGPSYLRLNRGRQYAALTWGLGPEIQVSERISVALGFDQDVQSPFAGRNAVYRNRVNLGLSYSYDR